MSSSHAYTADAAVNQQPSVPEDNEDDICPICESECTCDNKRTSSVAHTSSQIHSRCSNQDFSHGNLRPTPPSLKIKLTVPPNLLPKSRAIIEQNRPAHSPNGSPFPSRDHRLPVTGEFSLSDPRLRNHLLDTSIPKRRGRPPKVAVATLAAAAVSSGQGGIQLDTAAGPSAYGIVTARPRIRPKSKLITKKIKPPSKSRAKDMTAIKSATSRKRTVNGGSCNPRGLSRRGHHTDEDNDEKDLDEDDDTNSLRFPTFISVTGSSSSSSSSSDIDSSNSEDVELRMEEESYILDSEQEKERRNRHHDKARLKRELFGERQQRQKGRSHHVTNRWEIKPRRKSVAGSDAEVDADMDIDTDGNSTEAGDEEDPEDRSAEEDDDTEVNGVDRDGRRKIGVSFAGIVTGWSEGEESSYDADLFFANLDDSDSDSGSAMTLGNSSMDADGEDGGPDGDSADDLGEAMSLVAAAELEGFPFNITDGWDGQFVFTNGPGDRDVDMATDLSPGSNPGHTHRAHHRHKPSSDIDLVSSSLLTSDEEVLVAGNIRSQDANTEEEYYRYHNGVELAESDGETTEDELVGEDGLPNARAMMLFRWPVSVSSVDPMSTLSPSSRSTTNSRVYNPEDPHNRTSTTPVVSTGTTSNDESEGINRGGTNSNKSFDDRVTPSRRGVESSSSNSTSRITPKTPAFGHFEVAVGRVDPFNRAIIDGQHPELPSPYPRTKRPNKHSGVLENSRRHILRDRSLSISGQSSMFGEELRSTPNHSTEFEMFSAESMDLDDVLDAAFLAPEPSMSDVDLPVMQHYESDNIQCSVTDSRSGAEAGRYLNSLSRWDRIPMATFRRTREPRGSISNDDAGGWGSPLTNRDEFYAAAIRNTPLHSMISQTPKQRSQEAPSRNVLGSPVSLDGDRIPSNIRNTRNFHTLTQSDDHSTKSEREKKEEKKMKRKMAHKTSKGKGKSCSPQNQPHHRHQHHQHHPNSKSRASSSMQRNNFFSTSSLPPTNC